MTHNGVGLKRVLQDGGYRSRYLPLARSVGFEPTLFWFRRPVPYPLGDERKSYHITTIGVRRPGFEPGPDFSDQPLKLACLPFHHQRMSFRRSQLSVPFRVVPIPTGLPGGVAASAFVQPLVVLSEVTAATRVFRRA